jgi:hypothetical protein
VRLALLAVARGGFCGDGACVVVVEVVVCGFVAGFGL